MASRRWAIDLTVPKAELHVHLEGAASPDLVRRLGARNRIDLPEDLFSADGHFAWSDFASFLRAYDAAARVIQTPEDYRDITFEYLADLASEGTIYAELMSSPDHAAQNGMSYQDHVAGIAQGIEDARGEHGIEGFIVVTCVRHFGLDRAMEVAEQVVANPHPLVVGFGMGGDELAFPPAQFASVFKLIDETAGLACTVHAGEFDGPDQIWTALDVLGVDRLGHGVRAIEDPDLVAEIAARGITLECGLTSNIATGVYEDLAHHPWRQLRDAGCRVTLNTDDPPYFHTSLGREYQLAKTSFNLSDQDLLDVTRHAIEGGFAPADVRARLLAKLGGDAAA